jgi:hypothetical protein
MKTISNHVAEMMEEYLAQFPKEKHDEMKLHGFIYVRTFDPTNDETKEERFVPNLITTKGFNKYLQAVFNDETVAKGTWLAVGTTATSLAASDTDLEATVQIIGGTFTHTEDTAQGTVAYTLAGTQSETWSIVEMGLFDAATSGTLICRGTFAAVNKGTADSFEGKYIHSLS